MQKRHLTAVNLVLVALTFFLLIAHLFLSIFPPREISFQEVQSAPLSLPKNPFEQPAAEYISIGSNLLHAGYTPPELRLPDLRQALFYHGRNGRPDLQGDEPPLHFSIGGSSPSQRTFASMKGGEPLYLTYDHSSRPPRLIFEPNNQQTKFWINAVPGDNDVEVTVHMLDERGKEVQPAEQDQGTFRLPERDLSRVSQGGFDIDGQRADGALLARQKAKWMGVDRFLERHGGEEYQFVSGRQRIDFEDKDQHPYSVFIKPGEILVWEDSRWVAVPPGERSLGRPLLVLRRIDDRVMTFELWDPDGKQRLHLNILKTPEPWNLQNPTILQQNFKFLGSQTKNQAVFLIDKKRMVLSPSDWLLLTPKGWRKLASAQDIEQYVNRELTGTLLIFDHTERRDEKQVMYGELYSPSRTEYQPLELSLETGYTKRQKPPDSAEESKDVKGRGRDKKTISLSPPPQNSEGGGQELKE